MTDQEPQQVIHHHTDDSEYSLEVVVTSINYSISIKSDQKDQDLKGMVDLAIDSIRRIRKIEQGD